MSVRPATHADAPAIVGIIMDTHGAHVSRRGTVPQVERMLNAARRRDDYLVFVAERAGRVRGFLAAMRVPRMGLWEDRSVWQVQFLMGRNVLRPLVRALRDAVATAPILMAVEWADDPRAGTLHEALRRMGFGEHAAIMAQETRT